MIDLGEHICKHDAYGVELLHEEDELLLVELKNLKYNVIARALWEREGF